MKNNEKQFFSSATKNRALQTAWFSELSASKQRKLFSTALYAAALIFAFTLCPAAGYAQPSGGCSGVSNITIGSTTYVPTWCQEFNGAVGSAIDTTQWNFDLGNNGGWGNGEVEVYCGPPGYAGNPSQCPTTFSTATAPVYIDGNGHLVIQPINENGSWLSGRLNTEGKENFTYGILVASIEGPNTNAQGLWPAWWALGSNITTVTWPTCGESDMFEDWSPQVLGGAGTAGLNSTVHTQDTGGTGVSQRFTFPSGEATNTGFHTYGIVWVNNNMQFFVDNPSSPFFTVTPSSLPSGDTWPFNQSMFALLNVAVGGTLGGSTSGLTSPASPMTVDYVRWYTPSTGGGGVTDAPFGGSPATIAGTVMAENYDTGGQGVGYNVTSVNGSDNAYRSDGVDLELSSAPATGNDIGWTAAGQWFRYTVNVSTAGTYTVNFLVSAGGGSAVTDAFHLSNSAGTNLSGAVAVPNTGGWQTWTTVTATVTLPAGVQTLTLNQDAGGWNINSMVFASGYNVYGIYTDGTSFTTGGLDTDGYAYSSSQLGTTLSWNGSTFTFGPANAADVYSNETITLPAGQYGTLQLLATGVNGNQASQTFTVTYTDGTTTTITQSLSDWFTPQSYAGESTVKTMTYRDTSTGGTSAGSPNLYGYSFSINSAKTVQSLTLPSNRNVVVLAYTLVAPTSGTTSGSTSISAGGPASGSFVADADYSGGTTASTTATIDTSLISAPVPPQSVFQNERQGVVTYTLPGFTPGAAVALNLYFAEINFTAAGQREFNVLINGSQVLANFDIFANTGAANKAIQQNFSATANSSGQVVIQLTTGSAGQPQICGITATGA